MTSDKKDIASDYWYYTIELEKGLFTKGREHENVAITRKLLRNINVQQKTCIDIGVQEALVSILLKKAGAKHVVAYDRYDLSTRIDFLQDTYQVDFDYVSGVQIQELPQTLREKSINPLFDLVIFSGVLYHMINPFGLMTLVRSLCKVGGLFLIETVAVQHPKEMLIFNARAEIYGPSSNYFLPTTAWLDYALRMIGLLPVQAIYLGEMQNESPIRLALLCRSLETPCPIQDDEWMFNSFHKYIFKEEAQFDWENIKQQRASIEFSEYDHHVVDLQNSSLYEKLNNHPRYIPSRDEIILTLESKM